MNVQKITNQLTKEVKRNPAKAAVLGGLLLVAIWFWYPLVQKWAGGSSSSVTKQSATEIPKVPASNAISVPTSQPVKTTAIPSQKNWRSIAQLISDDPWMKAGTLRHEDFDPFFPNQQPETALTAAEAQPSETPSVDVSPDTAGLVVTSVIVGGKQAIARINNQNYHIGDVIRAEEANIKYTLLDVKPWGVKLQGTQQVHELPIDETPAKANRRLVLRNGNLISQDN